jgi:hypothetical protein
MPGISYSGYALDSLPVLGAGNLKVELQQKPPSVRSWSSRLSVSGAEVESSVKPNKQLLRAIGRHPLRGLAGMERQTD